MKKNIVVFIFVMTCALPIISQTAEDYYNQADALNIADKNEAKQAVNLLSKALDADPAYIKAWVKRAEIYDSLAMYKEEIADLTTLINKDSSTALYYKKRAAAYLLKNEAEKSIADYTKAYSLDSSMIECIYERGKIYGELYITKKSQQAIDDFTLCIGHASINIKSLSYVGRGRVYENKEEFDKAMADYNTAIKVNPFCKDAFLYRGLLKLALNQDGCYDLLKYREMYGANAQEYLNKYCYK